MNLLRSFHWLVTGVLFLLAMAFYLIGYGTGALAVGLTGFVFETAAWLSFAGHPRKPTSTAKASNTGPG